MKGEGGKGKGRREKEEAKREKVSGLRGCFKSQGL
jgi:hypothetical protein